MAQVIKYQQGGSTSRKYGTFTIDGNKYEVDDEFLNQITSYGKSLDDETAYQFSKITDALRSGADLSYDSNADKLDGNVQFDVTDKQNDRLGKRRSRMGRLFGNSWRGKENTSRNAIHALKGFTYVKPTPGGTDYDWSKGINVEYKRDKDGKYELVDGKRVFIQGANNLQVGRRLGALKNIASYTDNDTFKGYGKLDKQAYIDLYNRLGEEGVNNLIQRVENGTWTDEDKLALDDIGIFLGDEPSAEQLAQKAAAANPEAQLEQQERDRYAKAGWDYNLRNIIGINDDGSASIINPELQSYIGTGDAWLNDEFRKAYGAYADYIPEKTGLFVINGKVYKGDNQDSLSKIQKYLDFVAENRKTAGNASNIKQYWKENDFSGWSDLGYDSNGNPIYSTVFKPGEFGRDITGNYIRNEGDPYIFDYYKDYNAEDDALFDQFGHPLRDRATRVFIDPITKKPIDANDSRYRDYIANLREQSNKQVVENYYQNATGSIFSPYYNLGNIGNVVRTVGTGSDTNPFTGYSVFQKPGSDMYYWYDENPGGDDYTLNSVLPGNADKMRDYIWNLDPRLGQYLTENPEALRDTTVKNAISGFVRNPYIANISGRRTLPSEFPQIQTKYPALAQLLSQIYNQGTTIGYGNYRKTYSGSGGNPELRDINSPEALESRGLAYRIDRLGQIPYQKEGGVLKMQIGGTAASRTRTIKASQDNVQRADSKLRKAGEDKVIGDGTELNSTDKAELAALIADAASLGATFVPVYGNVAGAGIGAVGSLTGFGADVARDGLDWGDVGNLALNLGLDAATLLPGVGTGAKATKIAKALKKSKAIAKAVKYASMTLSGGSAIAGLSTAWNNIQDGKWTIRDIRTVLNGVRGVANIGRTKGSAKTKATASDTVTLKPKSQGLPEIKLNRTELEAIQNAPKGSRSDKLEELLISRLPKKAKTDQVTDVLAEYGISRSGSMDWSWRKPLTFNRSNTINTKQFDFDKIPGTYRNPNELGWWNWNRRAAIRDAKTNRSNPYFKDFARTQTSEIPKTPLEIIRRPEIDGNVTRTQIFDPNIQITSYRRAPITRLIYSNFAPNLGVFSTTSDSRYYYDPNNRPTFYKKGGKIMKAKIGANSGWFIGKDGKPLVTQAEDVVVTAKAPNTRPQVSFGVSPVNTFDPNIRKGMERAAAPGNAAARARVESELTPDNTSSTGMYGHGSTKKAFNINPDMLLGIGDFITSTRGINRTTQKMKDAIRKGMIGSQQQMPTEFYSRFSDNGLHRMYNDRINNMRQYKTVTSDPNQVMAERLMRDMNVDQMENERDTKFSQMIDQYNDKLLAQKQQYSNMRTRIVNDNKNRWYQGLAQLDMADANKIGQQTQNVKNLIYQFRQDNARDVQERQQAQLASKQLQADNAFNRDLSIKYQPAFNALTPAQQKEYGSLENYVYLTDPKGFNSLKNQHYANFAIDQYNEGPAHSWFGRKLLEQYKAPYQYIPQPGIRNNQSLKKGGRVQRFRDVDEQAFLDQQKAINKAVNDLNNNIIKLFIKMMS